MDSKTESEVSATTISAVARFTSAGVLGSEVLGDDAVVLTVANMDSDGLHTDRLLMKKIGGDWKLAGPPPK
jgi:hypothetical protein